MSLDTTLSEGGTGILFTEARKTATLLRDINKMLSARADDLRGLVSLESNLTAKQAYQKNLKIVTDLQEEVLDSVDASIKITIDAQSSLVAVPYQSKQ